MKKSGIVWVFFVILISGCTPAKEKVQYKLDDEQLAKLVLDIQLSDVMMQSISPPKQDSLRDLFWLRLTEVYKLSESDIKAEIEKLESDADKMKEIINRSKAISDSIR